MTLTAIYCGGLLVIIAIAGYLYGISTGHASVTALIPAAFGLALAILGAIGKAKESLRKHLMHVAVLIALIGCIVPAVRLLRMPEYTMNAAFFAQLGMSLVCLAFVILSVRSFINARRSDV
jgi:hypothetical protein